MTDAIFSIKGTGHAFHLAPLAINFQCDHVQDFTESDPGHDCEALGCSSSVHRVGDEIYITSSAEAIEAELSRGVRLVKSAQVSDCEVWIND